MHRIRVVAPRETAARSRGGGPAGGDAIRDAAVIEGYLSDASGLSGEASALHRPVDEASLARIVSHAAADDVSITVSAARTSTTAAAVPHGGVVVSMEKLDQLIEIDAQACRARAQAGIVLGDFQRAIEARGFFYPPDPTSRNDCTLGGSVACNASGARSFRYGATRRWIEGLRVVLASGELLEIRRGEVVASSGEAFEIEHADGRVTRVPVPGYRLPGRTKHAGGYAPGPHLDLIDLFIGSEGTLGVVSEVEVEIRPLPEKVVAIWACLGDEAEGVSLAARAREGEGGVAPRCIEWLDAASLDLIRARLPDVALPGTARCAVYVEEECDASTEGDVLLRWGALLERSRVIAEVDHGVLVAADARQLERLRAARHAVPAGVNERAARNGMPKLGTDLAVPHESIQPMLALYRHAADDPWGLLPEPERAALLAELGAGSREQAALPERLDTVSFGHIGDGHVHVNFLPVSAPGFALARAVYAHLTHLAIEMGGSPSAEHGIGKLKQAALRELVGEGGIDQMRAVKRALDPSFCLGRGNLFAP